MIPHTGKYRPLPEVPTVSTGLAEQSAIMIDSQQASAALLWMAVVHGGGLIAGGLWMRRI